MNKLRLNSRRQVFQRFGAALSIPYKTDKGEERMAKFTVHPTLSRLGKFNINPLVPFDVFYWNLRSKSRLGSPCSICGSAKDVEMHHVRSLKARRNDNSFAQVMRNMNRKQIPVCRPCHLKIHNGQYDGTALRKITSNTR